MTTITGAASLVKWFIDHMLPRYFEPQGVTKRIVTKDLSPLHRVNYYYEGSYNKKRPEPEYSKQGDKKSICTF